MIFSKKRGFSLLEVMVALAILSLAFMTMVGINANSYQASAYARQITVATLLARGKMLDVERELQKDGFPESDKEFNGDFSKEGFPTIRWVATARQVEIDISPLVEGFLGGEVSSESLPSQMQAFLGAMNGQGPDEELNKNLSGNEVQKMLGGGQIEFVFKQISKTLGNSIREITLEITWGKGIEEESVKFVQYITTSGRISGPGGASAIPSLPGAGSRGNGNANAAAIPPTLPGGIPNPAAAKPRFNN